MSQSVPTGSSGLAMFPGVFLSVPQPFWEETRQNEPVPKASERVPTNPSVSQNVFQPAFKRPTTIAAVDQLSDRWRAPPSRFPNRRVPNRSTTRQGLSHEPSQATKKNVKKKNLFFFKQTTIVRSCGLPNYETKLIFFVLLFFCFKPGAT